MDSVEREIINIEKSMVKLFNEKKFDEIIKYFSKNFIGFSSTKHQRLNSISQLKKTFDHYVGDKVKFSIKNMQVKIYGESALTTFYWKVEMEKRKKSTFVEGRGSHLFLFIENKWQIVHEHFSRAH